MVGVMVVMMTFFKRTYASTPRLPELLYSVPLTLWEATVYPHLRQRLLDIHRQVWLSLFFFFFGSVSCGVTEYSLEGLLLKLKFQHFGHLM